MTDCNSDRLDRLADVPDLGQCAYCQNDAEMLYHGTALCIPCVEDRNGDERLERDREKDIL